jgi:paired amphipathic helix protein Sin3a
VVSVVHAKSIERLYADRRKEIIEGLYHNPVVAVPVILRRLKQKDQEWRKARLEWNKTWREVNEKNYHKSLDHQSFYFKQLEKKNLSPKVLIAEIKQRYQERLKSTSKLGLGPVHHLLYALDDPGITKEISALLTFVGEKTMSPRDRDKLDTFLLHFVQPFFWNKEDETDETPDDHEEEGDVEMDTDSPRKEVLVNGKEPSEGTTSKDSAVSMEEDDAHKSANSTNEKQAGVRKPTQNGMEGNFNGTSTQKGKGKEDSARLFYGNSNFYIFFRLYQILYERLAKAKEMAKSVPQENGDRPSVQVLLGKTKPDKEGNKDLYQVFLKNLRSLLSGELDQPRFEDDIREMFGISSYPLFTLDKLVSQLSKQLQTLLTDDTCAKLLNLYAHHEEGSTNRDFLESIYHANVLEILGEEKCFRFEFDTNSGGFSIQLLDSSHQPRFAELSFSKDKWKEYVIQYVQSDSGDVDVRKNHIFLIR